MINDDLKSLGLSLNERAVYLSLLKIGETSVGDIINDTRLHRQSVYNALGLLEEKQLVTKVVINKVNHYRLENPDVLLVNLKKQEAIAKSLSEKVKTELKKSTKEQEINIYTGTEKIKKFYLQRFRSMRAGSSLYVISNYSKKYTDLLGRDFLAKQDKLCQKRKIKTLILAGESFHKDFKDTHKLMRSLSPYRLRTMRFLPDYLMSPVAVEITEEAMSFNSMEDEWFMVEVRNKAYYEPYIKYFKGLWEIAKAE